MLSSGLTTNRVSCDFRIVGTLLTVMPTDPYCRADDGRTDISSNRLDVFARKIIVEMLDRFYAEPRKRGGAAVSLWRR
jgi:hypothetical protein